MTGLETRTSAAWARAVLRDPVALLNDHAHLEKKAAANALDLLQRWPDDRSLKRAHDEERAVVGAWTGTLAAIARDEAEHLALVLAELRSRGGSLTRTHRNPYAAALRERVRSGGGPDELVDRLCVSAVIEARSCERFERLAEAAEAEGLRRLYRRLVASEAGHHRRFLELAGAVPGGRAETRWPWWTDLEAGILSSRPFSVSMHGGEPTE
jgi:tRNA-(ms[2]io[6]A)-hydroxylase